MTSDSDNKPDDDQPTGVAGGDDFDEFDDFDDFDDFDEAAGLDAFDDEDDPFADDDESDPDAALDAAVDELDAMVEEGVPPVEPIPTPEPIEEAPPAVIPPAAKATATEAQADADDEFEADEFETDDFAAEGFDPDPMPAAVPPPASDDEPVDQEDDAAEGAVAETPIPDAPTVDDAASDEFAADEFQADEFEADEFDADEFEEDEFDAGDVEQAAAVEGTAPDSEEPGAEAPVADDVVQEPPAIEEAPSGAAAEDDDFAEIAAAFKSPIDEVDEAAAAQDDFADEASADDAEAAEAPETPETPEAAEAADDEALDVPAEEAGAAARSDDLDAMLAARAAESGGGNAPPPFTEVPTDAADDLGGDAGDGFDEAAVDAAFEEDIPADPAMEPSAEMAPENLLADDTDAMAADEAAFEEVPDPADEDAEELMPADDAVAWLGDDMAVSSEDSLAAAGDAEPALDAEPAADAEPVAEAPAPDMPAEPAEPMDDGSADEAAMAAAAGAAAASTMADEAPAAPAPAASAKPKRRKRKKQRGPSVPLIDVGEDGFDKVAEAYPKRLRAVQDLASRKMTSKGLEFAEKLCRKWAAKAQVPYRLELDAVGQALGGDPGAYVINLGFEMACTTAAADDPEGGRRLLHTMDWKLYGLGRMMVAARRHSPAGLWVNITWPGYLGCLQGVAPGRFAAAINHAPVNAKGPPFIAWPMSKMKWYGQKGMPPALLLRKAFDECEDFYAAVELIEKTPICYPAIFSVLGPEDGEFSIIERTETAKRTQKRAPAVTNHWLNKDFTGTVTAYQSNERLVAMKSRITQGVTDDEWLVHPVLNPETRLSVDLNPATGRMRVRGYQGVTPVTSLLDIYAD